MLRSPILATSPNQMTAPDSNIVTAMGDDNANLYLHASTLIKSVESAFCWRIYIFFLATSLPASRALVLSGFLFRNPSLSLSLSCAPFYCDLFAWVERQQNTLQFIW